jgi:hypothetical protein
MKLPNWPDVFPLGMSQQKMSLDGNAHVVRSINEAYAAGLEDGSKTHTLLEEVSRLNGLLATRHFEDDFVNKVCLSEKEAKKLLRDARHELLYGVTVASSQDGWVSVEKRISRFLSGMAVHK